MLNTFQDMIFFFKNADDVLPLAQTDHVRRTFHDFMWLREILKTRHDPE